MPMLYQQDKASVGCTGQTLSHLMRIASLILNLPGFSSIPSTHFPRGTKRSFARKCPSGYVARTTKYEEKDGALDLK